MARIMKNAWHHRGVAILKKSVMAWISVAAISAIDGGVGISRRVASAAYGVSVVWCGMKASYLWAAAAASSWRQREWLVVGGVWRERR